MQKNIAQIRVHKRRSISLRLMSCMFVPNFEAIGHVTSVLEPENRPESLA